jgi:hypothetical protein
MCLFLRSATVNKERYNEVLIYPWEAIRQKRPEMQVAKDRALLHNKAPAHQSLLVQPHCYSAALALFNSYCE